MFRITFTEGKDPMTKQQIERRLKTLGLRLERNGRQWIVRPDTIGSCMARSVVELRTLAEAAELVDLREILARETH